MTTATRVPVLCLLAIALCWATAHAATLPPAARGSKTLLLQVEPGPLSITLVKRDLNIYEGEDALHADLFDPLGRGLAEIDIPDDGSAEKSGPAEELQSAEMTVQCELVGVYRLGVRAPGDAVFGMETSAERYVVIGDLLFSDGSVGGQLFFEPPADEFTITASALHDPGRQVMPLKDADGNVLSEFNLDVTGEEHTVTFEAADREGLWHFDIAAMDVKMAITGITHWTCDEGAWFAAGKSRWMLMPYRTARYVQPGDRVVFELSLRNSTGAPDAFDVEIEADDGLSVELLEPDLPVELGPKQRATVRVAVTPREGAREGDEYYVGVTARAVGEPAAMASSGVAVRIGDSPVSSFLDTPIVLRPYEHEDFQFGYAPDYMRNEVYFDLENSPVIRRRTQSMYGSSGVFVLGDDGRWIERGFLDAIREVHADYSTSYGGGGFLGAKIAFDGQGGMYTMLRLVAGAERPTVLLFSPDEGLSWQVCDLPGAAFDVEQFTGHNALDIPPPVLCYVPTGAHPARFGGYHDLLLFMPERDGDGLVMGEPVKVAENCVGSCQHSGGPASTVTRDGRTHVVWGEISG